MHQHPLGEHLPECSGPDNCREYRAVLAMTPTQHANYLNESTARFASLRTAGARQFRASEEESTPNPYTLAIAERRRAEATPESAFAERYAADRTRELEEEYAAAARWAAERPAPQPVMSADELKQYEPPNSWAEGIRKLQQEQGR